MSLNGSGGGNGTGGGDSWMNSRPQPAAQRYDHSSLRPGGMSDDSDFEGSDDGYDYFPGFDCGDTLRNKRNVPQASLPRVELPPKEQLKTACSEKNLPTVKRIIQEHKVDINAPDFRNGWSLLTLSCQEVAFEIAEYLVEEKADLNFKGNDWYTPILALANSDAPSYDSDVDKIAQLLLNHGVNVNCVDTRGVRPIMFAVKNKYLNFIKILLEKGADVNAQDNVGLTALHYAAQVGSGQIVRILLENGADVTLTDESGATPLQTARNSKSDACLKVIQILEWVETSDWRPGKHPDLITPVVKDPFMSVEVDEYLEEEREDIEIYLVVNDMEKYVSKFKEQMIHSKQLVWIDDQQLQEIGVDDEDDRKFILTEQAQMRKKGQQCPPYMRDGWTSSEGVCLLSNIFSHVEYQTEVLEGFYRLIRDEPQLLYSGIETYTPTDLIEGSLRVTETTYKLENVCDQLSAALNEFERKYPDPEGEIPSGNHAFFKFAVFGVIAIGVGFGINKFLNRS